jgi:type II secretion system protein N
MPEFASYFTAQYWRAHLVQLGYAILALILFSTFLVSTFPYSSTLAKVLAPMGLEFSSTGQAIHFPIGAELTDVRVDSINSPRATPLFESPAVTISPSILLLHPGVRVKASAYDGVVTATARPSGKGTALSFNLDALDISRQHLFETSGLNAAGHLSGAGEFWISSSNIGADTGDGELRAALLTLISPIVQGPIRLGDAHAKFKLRDGILAIESFSSHGGDLGIEASGTVQLSPLVGDSRIAIQFKLTPSPAATSRLGLLFAILPRPPGPKPYQLTGTLNAPRIS